MENKKARVSGVPYEVNLPHGLDEAGIIAELERENAMIRARMTRLEDECREAQELVSRLNVELLNLRNKHNETFR